jgi:hypothetical protein
VVCLLCWTGPAPRGISRNPPLSSTENDVDGERRTVLSGRRSRAAHRTSNAGTR